MFEVMWLSVYCYETKRLFSNETEINTSDLFVKNEVHKISGFFIFLFSPSAPFFGYILFIFYEKYSATEFSRS